MGGASVMVNALPFELVARWRKQARAILNDNRAGPHSKRLAWRFLKQHGVG